MSINERMKVALANLGPLTYALRASLECLDVEVTIPGINTAAMTQKGSELLPPEMCHPLKLLLGNYLSTVDETTDAVIFYSGCDICNLSPINKSYSEIFQLKNCDPKAYYCDIKSKKAFVMSYINILKELSGKPVPSIGYSIYYGFQVYETLTLLDQTFYTIRPALASAKESESLYNSYFNKLISVSTVKEVKSIEAELVDLCETYQRKLPPDTLTVGLIGDTFSLTEPFTHHYLDKKLGHLGFIVDRWSTHRFISKHDKKKEKLGEYYTLIKSIIRQDYGAFSDLEIKKLSNYVSRRYDGLLFIAPLSCNPNDALRNLLSNVEKTTKTPILSLVFDEHTSATGTITRVEAFADLLQRQQQRRLVGNSRR